MPRRARISDTAPIPNQSRPPGARIYRYTHDAMRHATESIFSIRLRYRIYIYTYTLAAKIFSSKKSLACLILSFFYFSLKFTIRTFNIHLYVNLYIFFCSKYVRYYNFLRDATSFENLLMKIHDFPQFRFDLIIYRIIR